MSKHKKSAKKARPAQHQAKQPGLQQHMKPRPVVDDPDYRGSGKLLGKVALITGGDSGIGEAVAIAMAKEGADAAVVYLREHSDARSVQENVARYGRQCLAISGDVGSSGFCARAVGRTVGTFGRLDILVNNAAEQHLQESVRDITDKQLVRTFRTNIFAHFFMTRAALPHLQHGSTIINTTSVTAYRGSAHLLDYSATKGAIVAYTRSLAMSLVEDGIRVNGVAPGPIWTPLIPASFSAKDTSTFGTDVPMGRAGQPSEVAPCFVFLASKDSAYMTGQVLHPNGGEIING